MPFVPDKPTTGFIPDPIQPEPEDGLLKTIGKEIAEPLGEVFVSGRNVTEAIGALRRGDVPAASRALDKKRDLPFLGVTEPFVTGKETTPEAAKRIIGTGAEIFSIIPFTGGATTAVRGTFKGAIKPTAKLAAKEGALFGAAALGGKSLREDKKAAEVIGNTLLGAIGGATTGGLIGLVGPAAGAAARVGARQVKRGVQLAEPVVGKGTQSLQKFVDRLQAARSGNISQEMVRNEANDLASTWVELANTKSSLNNWISKNLRNPDRVFEEFGRQGLVPEISSRGGRTVLDTFDAQDKITKLLGGAYDAIDNEITRAINAARLAGQELVENADAFRNRSVSVINNFDVPALAKEKQINSLVTEIDALKRRFGANLPLDVINDLRRQHNRPFKLGVSEFDPDVDYAIATAARDAIDDLVDDRVIRNINKQVGTWIETNKLLQRFNNEQTGSGRFGLWFGRLIGTNVMGSRGGVQAVLGALGGDLLFKMIQRIPITSPIRRRILQELATDEGLLREAIETSSKRAADFFRKQMSKQKLLPQGSSTGSRIESVGPPIDIPPRGAVPRGLGDEPQFRGSVNQISNPAPTINSSNINTNIPKSVSQTTNKVNRELLEEAKKYKTADEFVNNQPQKIYHTTSADNKDAILNQGFKKGSELPEEAFRGGGYGSLQDSISFADNVKDANRFGISQRNTLIEAELKPNSKIINRTDIEFAEELNDEIPKLLKEGVDAVRIASGEGEIIVINSKAIRKITDTFDFRGIEAKDLDKLFTSKTTTPTKSQLEQIWKQANQ